MNQTELAALHARAEAALQGYPGVIGVGYGLKQVQGKTTRTLAWQVFVEEKKSPGDLNEAERIPEHFQGIPTDVRVVPELRRLHCQDMKQYEVLISGITVTNLKLDNQGNRPVGTLGFFATLNNDSSSDNVVLVSNHHVLAQGGAAVGDPIYQPERKEENGQVVIVNDERKQGLIAEIHDLGKEENVEFQYPGETKSVYHVDCASAKLKICISSACKCNCGIRYRNQVREPDETITAPIKITKVKRLGHAEMPAPGDPPYRVFKVGSRTSKTWGTVLGIGIPGPKGEKGIIEIKVDGVDCDKNKRFAAKGDSGSAILNEQNELVGLLFAEGTGANSDKAYACHIHPVLEQLGVTPITEENPPVGPAGEARGDLQGVLVGGNNEAPALRARFMAAPRGAEIHARFMEHRAEVVALVNHRRPVTVAWHRAQGPAFLSHLLENARHPEHRIPFEIEGCGRKALIERMAEVLTAHGSAALGAAIAAHRAEILAWIDRFDDLHELVARFEAGGSPGA